MVSMNSNHSKKSGKSVTKQCTFASTATAHADTMTLDTSGVYAVGAYLYCLSFLKSGW